MNIVGQKTALLKEKAIAEEVAQDAVLIGLMGAAVEEAREEDASAPGEPSSSSGGHEAPHPGDEVPDPLESGRIYFEGRSVLRLQRGDPRTWLCIDCYFHRSCQVTMKLSEEPPLRYIKRWARSVDPTPLGASSEVNEPLAAAHAANARELWPHGRLTLTCRTTPLSRSWMSTSFCSTCLVTSSCPRCWETLPRRSLSLRSSQATPVVLGDS